MGQSGENLSKVNGSKSEVDGTNVYSADAVRTSVSSLNKMEVRLTTAPKIKPDQTKLGFGQYFSDHMFVSEYKPDQIWTQSKITPYEPLPLDPAASVLHYGQALFEGMKAFRQNNGRIVLFRPEFNARRMIDGANRLCMKAPPVEYFVEAVKRIVKVDSSWVPNSKSCSLYIRPTLIGSEGFLGVRPSENFLFYIILSPVGSYYKEGIAPVKIHVEDQYLRAAPGGLGATKAGANYAASLKAALQAKKQGYAQVLWLDVNHKYIEEVGTMNVFFVIDGKIVTPELSGSILEGGVRNSTIALIKKHNLPFEERKISMDELVQAHKLGVLQEAFGTGTAAVISPIGELEYKSEKMLINGGKIGTIAQKLYNEITGIQYGDIPDENGWVVPIE